MAKIVKVLRGRWTLEGAGVKLYRVFGGTELAELTDPFLLLDHFGSRYPHEYLMGFPWHPHRGIETVTYVIKGEVHHEDSTGTSGVIRSGDIQWMTAGSGIFHSEMPKPMKIQVGNDVVEDPEMFGFQLWINLPSKKKMTSPRYRNLNKEYIPTIVSDEGVRVKVVAGEIYEPGTGVVEGPAKDLNNPVTYLDVNVEGDAPFIYTAREGFTALAYVYEGRISINGEPVGKGELAIFDRRGGDIKVVGDGKLLFLMGRPLREPIAWWGPIVMNTWEEIEKAIIELKRGDFIKKKATDYDYFV